MVMAGTPVVASDLPDMKEFINRNRVGVVVNARKPVDIAAAIRELTDKPELYNTLVDNCREAARVYNWENEASKMLQIYRRL